MTPSALSLACSNSQHPLNTHYIIYKTRYIIYKTRYIIYKTRYENNIINY